MIMPMPISHFSRSFTKFLYQPYHGCGDNHYEDYDGFSAVVHLGLFPSCKLSLHRVRHTDGVNTFKKACVMNRYKPYVFTLTYVMNGIALDPNKAYIMHSIGHEL